MMRLTARKDLPSRSDRGQVVFASQCSSRSGECIFIALVPAGPTRRLVGRFNAYVGPLGPVTAGGKLTLVNDLLIETVDGVEHSSRVETADACRSVVETVFADHPHLAERAERIWRTP
jgi:hypothetical protein